jgi:hypothetical protein
MRFIDLTGQTFGRLTVLARDTTSKRSRWHCQCVCGNFSLIFGDNLRSGHTTSCGCYLRDQTTRHGFARRYVLRHPLHYAWVNMTQRCYNRSNPAYPNYGARGIKVCDRWLGENGFANFITDVGERPPNPEKWVSRKSYWSLDRIDNDGDYEPGNVRWATPSEQQRNRRVSL